MLLHALLVKLKEKYWCKLQIITLKNRQVPIADNEGQTGAK